jgi:large subunit ribosomal protein L18e
MAKPTGPTNVYKRGLITELKRSKSAAWKDVAKKLSASRRRKVTVNVGEIDVHAKGGETIVVPGTVLANGKMDKAVTIAAWKFSSAAVEKIKKARGSALTIEELLKKNPKGSKIRIMI